MIITTTESNKIKHEGVFSETTFPSNRWSTGRGRPHRSLNSPPGQKHILTFPSHKYTPYLVANILDLFFRIVTLDHPNKLRVMMLKLEFLVICKC